MSLKTRRILPEKFSGFAAKKKKEISVFYIFLNFLIENLKIQKKQKLIIINNL